MKTPRFLALILVFAAIFAGLAPCNTARAETSFSYFYESLDPLGDWIKTDAYGYCWRPDGVDSDWAPYTDGYWAYTDAGWTWVSYEDWGSICYHYGRWVNLDEEGWCWVPDNQWAPAWVSWRNSDEYVGWAPLPPEAHFVEDVGISVWADSSYDIGPSHYNFCNVRDFGSPVLRQVIIPRFRNVSFIRNTVNVTNISYNRGSRFVFNGGPRYDVISARSSRPVPALKLVRNNNINIVNNNTTIINGNNSRPLRGLQHAIQRGNTLEVFSPAISAQANLVDVKPNRVKRDISNRGVNKGWAGMNDPAERESLKLKFREQTAGQTPQTTHARPVPVAELKAVPEKADPNAPSPFSNPKSRTGRNNQAERPGAPTASGNPPGAADVADQNPGIGKRNGNRPSSPVAVTPGQDAPAAGEPFNPAVEKGRKGRINPETGTPQEPGRGERVASPVATAEREKMLGQQAEKKREKAEALETKQQQAATAKEAAQQRHDEQVQARQAAVARQQAEHEAANAAQGEKQQQNAAARKMQQAEQPRRQGQLERGSQEQRPNFQEPQQQRLPNQAAREIEARQQQQQQGQDQAERNARQQEQRRAQMERAQMQQRAVQQQGQDQAERSGRQQEQRQAQMERAQIQQRGESQRAAQQQQQEQRAAQMERAQGQQRAAQQQQQQQQQRPPQQDAPNRGQAKQAVSDEDAAAKQKNKR